MSSAGIDFSVSKDLDRLVTWQYDGAKNLCGIIDMFKAFMRESLEKSMESTLDAIAGVGKWEEIDEDLRPAALAFWMRFLGISRPHLGIVEFISENGDGTTSEWKSEEEIGAVSDDTMWRLVVGILRWMASDCTRSAFDRYCSMFTEDDSSFGVGVREQEYGVMQIRYFMFGTPSEKRHWEWAGVFTQSPGTCALHPAGVLVNYETRFFTVKREGSNVDTGNLGMASGGPFRYIQQEQT